MSKKNYEVVAKVDQIVTKEVHLVVSADSPEEAEAKARAALSEYPEKVTDGSVKRILTAKQHFWIPKSIEFGPTKEQDKNG